MTAARAPDAIRMREIQPSRRKMAVTTGVALGPPHQMRSLYWL